ncbi:MAG: hypothetical protein ACTH2Q_00390 [Propionibacteriaceae bacterium]
MRKRIIGGAAALVLTAGMGLAGLSATGENADLNSLKARTVQTDSLNSLGQKDDLNSLGQKDDLNSLGQKDDLNSLNTPSGLNSLKAALNSL